MKSEQGPEFWQPKEYVPTTGHELVEIIEAGEFNRALTITGQYTKRTGLESGFSIDRDLYSRKYWLLDIHGGETTSLQGSTAKILSNTERQLKNMLESEGSPFVLIDLHYHPSEEQIIVPSLILPNSSDDQLEGDLIFLTRMKKAGGILLDEPSVRVYPVMAIGQVEESGKTRLLLIQERFKPYLDEMHESTRLLSEELDVTRTQEDVVNVLRSAMYLAELIELDQNNKVRPEQKELLNKFGFAPKPLE